ncbi:MAG: hypothetical protein SGI92_19600 [Bryobacteraceae bacterium]|nr:hypothetical protein [Bryobacteraceae bacterium]
MNRSLLLFFCTLAGVVLFVTSAVSQSPPAPMIDRVGFPANYKTMMKVLYKYDRQDNRQVRTIFSFQHRKHF